MPFRPTLHQYELIYDNTFDSIFLISVEGPDRYRVLSVNPRFLKATGLRQEQVIGKRVDEIYPDEHFAYLRERYREAIACGGPFRYETRTDRTSTEAYIDTTLVPTFDKSGHCTHLIGVSRDITRNKLERRALKEAKRRAESYLDIAEAIIVAFDIDGNVTMMNRKGYQMLGYQPGSLIGRNWSEFCIMPEKREAFRRGFDALLREGGTNQNVNYVQRSDGERVLVSWVNTVVHDDQGNAAGVLSSGEDITERRRAEKALIASQRMLAAEEVVSSVAHDFNNALQGIVGNIDLALELNGSHTAVEFLHTAKRLTEDAASRIKALRRARADGADDQTVPVNELVDEVVDETRHLWREEAIRQGHDIVIETDLSPDVGAVLGNRSELRTVLYNIVKNAVESIEDKGSITFRTRIVEDRNVIQVIDTGKGMDNETSARIFQPFFSTKGLEAGRGLGLSASHRIVRAHGGDILVRDTAPDSGTTFEIALPGCESGRGVDAVTAAALQDGTHHLLWVDDDATVQSLAAGYIKALGCTGDVVDSGEAALASIASGDYSVVITDIGMPGMNGFDLAKQIREQGNQMPLIALTGWGETLENAGEEVALFDCLLGKPVNLAEFRKTLNRFAAPASTRLT